MICEFGVVEFKFGVLDLVRVVGEIEACSASSRIQEVGLITGQDLDGPIDFSAEVQCHCD